LRQHCQHRLRKGWLDRAESHFRGRH
jgi:hypothetical protein